MFAVKSSAVVKCLQECGSIIYGPWVSILHAHNKNIMSEGEFGKLRNENPSPRKSSDPFLWFLPRLKLRYSFIQPRIVTGMNSLRGRVIRKI